MAQLTPPLAWEPDMPAFSPQSSLSHCEAVHGMLSKTFWDNNLPYTNPLEHEVVASVT